MHGVDALIIHRGARLEASWLLWPFLVVGAAFSLLLGETGHAFIYFQF